MIYNHRHTQKGYEIMYFKRIAVWITVILLGIVLFACDTDDQPLYNAQDVYNVLDIGFQGEDTYTHVTKQVVIPTTVAGFPLAQITWEIFTTDLIDIEGTIYRQDEDQEAVLIATIKVGASVKQKPFTLIIKGTRAFADVHIEIYQERMDDLSYERIETIVIEDEIVGSLYTYEPITPEHFIIDEELTLLSGTVTDDGLILEVYLARQRYQVNFVDRDETLGYVIGKYDEEITAFLEPEREGYTFLGWSTSLEENTFVTALTLQKDETLYAKWELIQSAYDPYYEGIDGLSGDQLVDALHAILNQGTTLKNYGDSRDILQQTDKDPQNTSRIILVYVGRSVPAVWDNGITWNREHVWPQSLLGVSVNNSHVGKGSDLHNLKPSDPSENNSKGNKYFDNQTTGSTYEPRDEVKGDIARILFYMAIMYDDLDLVNRTPNVGEMGKLSALLAWHINDPVDDFERNRNNIIYTYQGNRNPFIDYPELVDFIWDAESLTSVQPATHMVILYIERKKQSGIYAS
jgi:uncharacterized repeat protein (TIGR02543 family)